MDNVMEVPNAVVSLKNIQQQKLEDFIRFTEAATALWNKVFLKVSQIFHVNSYVGVFLW